MGLIRHYNLKTLKISKIPTPPIHKESPLKYTALISIIKLTGKQTDIPQAGLHESSQNVRIMISWYVIKLKINFKKKFQGRSSILAA